MLTALALMLAQPAAAEPGFNGIVALPGCSGSLFHFAGQSLDDDALVLTNGHCIGRLGSYEVLVHEPYETEVILYDASGSQAATYYSDEIVYGTMHDTDLAVLRLPRTYRELAENDGVDALLLDDERGIVGEDIAVVSGLWEYITTCELDGFVYSMIEGDWAWTDSIRMTEACETFGGTSGSPILSVSTNQIIGVNNTGFEGGEPCTVNNPCEVDEQGQVTTIADGSYGQQTLHLYSCIDEGFGLDLSREDCALPVPRGVLAVGPIDLSSSDECDGDGILDVGERGTLTVRIDNDGPVALTDARVRVTSDSPYVTLTDAEVDLGELRAFGSTEVEVEVTLDEAVPSLEALIFDVEVTDAEAAEPQVLGAQTVRVHYDSLDATEVFDDVESPVSAWTPTGSWARMEDAGETTWHTPDLGEPGTVALVSPQFIVGNDGFTLSFDQRFRFESGSGVHYDGGVIEVSLDDGETWMDANAYAELGYGGVITDESGNPLANRGAYVASSPGWPDMHAVSLDFGAELANRVVRVRFVVGTDAAVGDFGWELDNFEVDGLRNRPFHGLGGHDESCGAVTEEPPVDEEPEAAGCGCAVGGTGAAWLPLVLALGLVRRRE